MEIDIITIRDPMSRRIVSGKLIKRFEKGLTMEDSEGVRYYVDFSYVISEKKD